MDIVEALASLVRVTEAGSFSAVARERDVSKAAVARQISCLEQHFGVRLLHRTTRKLNLTDDGQTLLGLAKPVLEGIENIEAVLGRQSASAVGLVRVGIMVAASHFLAPRLPALLAGRPGLRVELVVSDKFGGMIEDRLDLAVRVGEVTDASVIARRIGIAARVVVAAPIYVQRHGSPRTQPNSPGTIASSTTSSRIRTRGPLRGRTACATSRYPAGFLASDGSTVHLAARAGYGIAFLPLVQVADDLRRGELVRLLSGYP